MAWPALAVRLRAQVAGQALSAKLVRGSTLKVYPGAPHGLASTHQEQFNADLLAFVKT